MSHDAIRCRHCNGINLLPARNVNEAELSHIRAQAGREATRRLVSELLSYARDNPQRVWSRCIAMEHTLNPEAGKLLKRLAERLNVSLPRASQAITEAEETLRSSIT